MLSKIENTYLYLLRVLVLAVATAALVVLVLGVIGSLPLITDRPGAVHMTYRVPETDLGAFIEEKRAEGVTAPPVQDGDPTAPPDDTPANIRSAATLLVQYVKTRDGQVVDEKDARSALMGHRAAVPAGYQDAYGDSLTALMRQLVKSTGRSLSIDQINDLIKWHQEKFTSAAEANENRKIEKRTQAITALGVAGGALVAFFLVVFCFLFVKIERNLRLVHVSDGRGP